MKISKTASRYAKALLDMAVENGVLEDVHSDMRSIDGIIDDSRELRVFLASRVIKDEAKFNVLDRVLNGKVNELTLKFIKLLSAKNRASLLKDICIDFENKYELHKRILRLSLISAVPLDDETKSKIRSVIKSETWNEVVFEEEIDESIIGGFILKTDFVQFDAGVRSKLNELKQSFLNRAVA